MVPAGYGDGRIDDMLNRIQKDTVLTLEPHLAVFDGLKNLEQDGASVKGMTFASQTEAFDAAAGALRTIMEGLA
jgi:hypothetical protein